MQDPCVNGPADHSHGMPAIHSCQTGVSRKQMRRDPPGPRRICFKQSAQSFALILKNHCRGAPAIKVWFWPLGSEAT